MNKSKQEREGGKSRRNLSREDRLRFFFLSLKKVGNVEEIMITKKRKNKQQEEEIEFILFSLCAFEKSLDLGCNFIIIFIKARNKAKCIVQNQRKRKDFLFRNEKINK